jgi:hypothetical protein
VCSSDLNNDDGRLASVDDASNGGGISDEITVGGTDYTVRSGAYERGIQFGIKHTF